MGRRNIGVFIAKLEEQPFCTNILGLSFWSSGFGQKVAEYELRGKPICDQILPDELHARGICKQGCSGNSKIWVAKSAVLGLQVAGNTLCRACGEGQMTEKSWDVKNASVLEEERAAQGKLQGRQQECRGMWVVNGGVQTGRWGFALRWELGEGWCSQFTKWTRMVG